MPLNPDQGSAIRGYSALRRPQFAEKRCRFGWNSAGPFTHRADEREPLANQQPDRRTLSGGTGPLGTYRGPFQEELAHWPWRRLFFWRVNQATVCLAQNLLNIGTGNFRAPALEMTGRRRDKPFRARRRTFPRRDSDAGVGPL